MFPFAGNPCREVLQNPNRRCQNVVSNNMEKSRIGLWLNELLWGIVCGLTVGLGVAAAGQEVGPYTPLPSGGPKGASPLLLPGFGGAFVPVPQSPLNQAPKAAPEPGLQELVAPHPLDLPVDVPPAQAPVITAVALDRAGRLFATGGDDHLVRLWELPDGRLQQRLEGHRGWVRTVAFSPDGQLLASAGDDRTVILFRVGQAEPVWKAELPAAVYALAWSGDGSRLAVAGFSDRVWLLDAQTGRQLASFPGPGQDIRALSFSPDGRQLAAGCRQGLIRLWETASGVRQQDISAHRRRVRCLVYGPDGRLLVSGGEDGQIVACSAAPGGKARQIAKLPGAVYALAFCGPDRLAVGATDNRIRLVRLSDGQLLRDLAGHTGTVAALAWESGTQRLISGGFDTTVRFWQLGPPPAGPLTQAASQTAPLTRADPIPLHHNPMGMHSMPNPPREGREFLPPEPTTH